MLRFKTRPQFQAALGGATVARTVHFALHRAPLDAGSSEQALPLFDPKEGWIGAMVPKRWAKRAVTRNAIKRQIYAVSSEMSSVLPRAAHLVRLRLGYDRAQFKSATSEALTRAVRAEVQVLLSKALGSGGGLSA
ncbi:MAG: ribonuclease P protein component [Burkholderiaceae bacterium]